MKAVAVALAVFAAVPAVAAEPPRDPFAPFDTSEKSGVGERCKETAAACASLDDITLKGVISGTATPRAMVEVKGGQNVVLRTGDLLAAGRIVAIRRGSVVIERVTFSMLGGSKKSLIQIAME